MEARTFFKSGKHFSENHLYIFGSGSWSKTWRMSRPLSTLRKQTWEMNKCLPQEGFECTNQVLTGSSLKYSFLPPDCGDHSTIRGNNLSFSSVVPTLNVSGPTFVAVRTRKSKEKTLHVENVCTGVVKFLFLY